MKTLKTAGTFLMCGLLFAACQSDNKKTANQSTDTPSRVVYNDINDDTFGRTTAPVTAAPDTSMNSGSMDGTASTSEGSSATGTAGMRSDENWVCYPRKRAQHRVANNTHRRARKTRSTLKHETEITAVTPPAAEPPAREPSIVTVPETTVERQGEFSGYVPAPVNTAPPRRSKVHLAPEVGFNLNNLYNHGDGYWGSNQLKVGFHGGIMVNAEMGKRWAFQPGVRYIMKGGELTSSDDDPGYHVEHKDKLTFHYIEVPLNFVYNAGDWGTSHFMVGVGPYVSYLANAQDKVKDKEFRPDGIVVKEGTHKLTTGDVDEYGKVRMYDAGVGAFVGYQMRGGMYVKAGAEAGLVDLQKGPKSLSEFNDRNYNFLLSIGYLCGYKK